MIDLAEGPCNVSEWHSPERQRELAYPRVVYAPTYPDALPPDDAPAGRASYSRGTAILSNIATTIVCVGYLAFMLWVAVAHGGPGSAALADSGDSGVQTSVIVCGAMVLAAVATFAVVWNLVARMSSP